MFDIKSTPLPDYTRKEDIANSVTHALGIPFCIAGLIFLVRLQMHSTVPSHYISTVLYIGSTLLVFAGSAIYHGLKPGYAKQIARLIDHCNIYVMISGNTTAYLFTHVYETNPSFTIKVTILTWVLSAIGIVLTFMDLKRFNIPQVFMYMGLGWIAVLSMKSVYHESPAGKAYVLTVLLGGLFVTIGAVLYLIGKKHRYFHAVFHVFVLIGVVCFMVATYNFFETIFI